DRLVNLWSNAAGLDLPQFPLSPDLYYFFRTETKSFQNSTIFDRRDANITDKSNPESVASLRTSRAYFDTFGIVPGLRQTCAAVHDVEGAPLVVVISHRLWQRRFGADPTAIGRTLEINGETATILGVLPSQLDENGSPDLWTPARFNQSQPPTGTFGWLVTA